MTVKKIRDRLAKINNRRLVAITGTTTIGRVDTTVKADDSLEKEYKRVINKALREVIRLVDAELIRAIESGGWASGPIVDSGKLLRSSRVERNGNSIRLLNDVPYAALIHYGGYVRPYGNPNARPVYIPGRPWIEGVLKGGGPAGSRSVADLLQEAIDRITQ